MNGPRSAVGFLTVVPASAPLTPAAVPWFAVVGAVAGAVLGTVWWAAGEVLDPLTAAAVVIALDAALTGGLHYDGLLDSADGLLPHLPRERRLEVMRDPTVGSFAVVTGIVVVLLKWSSLAAIEPSVLLLTTVLAASRALAAVALVHAAGGPAGRDRRRVRVGAARGRGCARRPRRGVGGGRVHHRRCGRDPRRRGGGRRGGGPVATPAGWDHRRRARRLDRRRRDGRPGRRLPSSSEPSAEGERHADAVRAHPVLAEGLARHEAGGGVQAPRRGECLHGPGLEADPRVAPRPGQVEEVVEHRPARTAATGRRRGVHRLQLGVAGVESLQRPDREQGAVLVGR